MFELHWGLLKAGKMFLCYPSVSCWCHRVTGHGAEVKASFKQVVEVKLELCVRL